MSYALKYYTTFYDKLNFAQWTVDIYENGYGGSSSAFVSTDEPVTISYPTQDIQEPIRGSECVVSMIAPTAGTYDEFMTAVPLQYYVIIKKGSAIYWQGVNTTDVTRRKDAAVNYEFQIRFNCGLGELQWQFYEDGGDLYNGYEQVIQVINNCFSFLPYNLPVREIIEIREDNMDDTKGLLEQLYLSDLAFTQIGNDGELHGKSCNQMLNDICMSLNCRIYQSNAKWYIERITDRINSTVTYFDYTLTGSPATSNAFTHSGTGTLDWRNVIDNDSFPKLLDTSDIGVTLKHSTLAAKFDITIFSNIELIPNPFFEDNPVDLSGVLPKRWDRSTDIISIGGDGVEKVNQWTSDPRYQTGYSFGSLILVSNTTHLNLIKGFSPLNNNTGSNGIGMGRSIYSIHAVQRAGDVYTNNSVLINPSLGSISINMALYFKFTLTTNYTSNYKNEAYKDFLDLATSNNLMLMPAFKMFLEDSSLNKYYVNQGFTSWIENPAFPNIATVKEDGFTFAWLLGNAEWLSTGGVLPAGNLMPNLLNMLLQSYTNGTNKVDIEFYLPCSNTLDLSINGVGIPTGALAFDFTAIAPWIKLTASPTMTATVDYAIDAVDIQYIENAQTSNAYTAFYSSPDVAGRWSELDLDLIFGDGVTNSYPGAFRLPSLAETSVWHNLVGTKVTGQKLPDLLFKNFLGLIDKYRRSIVANMFGEISFQDTIEDEDGKLYMQTGHTFNIKSASFTIDMEEMAQIAISGISVNTYGGALTQTPPININNAKRLPVKIPLPIPIGIKIGTSTKASSLSTTLFPVL